MLAVQLGSIRSPQCDETARSRAADLPAGNLRGTIAAAYTSTISHALRLRCPARRRAALHTRAPMPLFPPSAYIYFLARIAADRPIAACGRGAARLRPGKASPFPSLARDTISHP
ncbi:hypothetical protein C8J57DRAFT_1516510 [Mycena rebaudengoi]|nr:hypothetical protein C8J57DRAFT_1516510 [Mycena rebaudengoi]